MSSEPRRKSAAISKSSKQLYEAGGQYAAADSVFMKSIRANADNAGSYGAAREHFGNRQEQSFSSNNAAALEAVKGYKPDPKLLAEVCGDADPSAGTPHAEGSCCVQ